MSKVYDFIGKSFLWASYGDALGFVTELTDEKGVLWRSGKHRVDESVEWRRKVGGRFGATVTFPAGTYSDDTQLRLSVARSIGSGGFFDVESFAKIELPLWSAYALGGGRGCKEAASNLKKKDVNWFSNFFQKGKNSYVQGGGNGAAMRIQPHVWSRGGVRETEKLSADIFRDSICTHGHPRGIAGAILHGWALNFSFKNGKIPDANDIKHDARALPEKVEWIIKTEELIKTFWVPSWEERVGNSFLGEMERVSQEVIKDIDICIAGIDKGKGYGEIIEDIGGYDPEQRGSGVKAHVASCLLGWLYPSMPHNAILEAANALGSDTDTIGTMAGALIGGNSREFPKGKLQDKEYMLDVAEKLSKIAQGQEVKSFPYPDPGTWNPPKNQKDLLNIDNGKLVIRGLGAAATYGDPVKLGQGKGQIFQWVKMQFGQTLLVKTDEEFLKEEAGTTSLFNDDASLSYGEKENYEWSSMQNSEDDPKGKSIDLLTKEAIDSGFDPAIIGGHILSFSEKDKGIEEVIAYVSIVVKAKRARYQKGR